MCMNACELYLLLKVACNWHNGSLFWNRGEKLHATSATEKAQRTQREILKVIRFKLRKKSC